MPTGSVLLQAPAPDGQSRKPHQHGEGFPSCRPPPQGLELVGLGAGVVVVAVVVVALVVVVGGHGGHQFLRGQRAKSHTTYVVNMISWHTHEHNT